MMTTRSSSSYSISKALTYLEKWFPISFLIGMVCGLGACIFYVALDVCTDFFLGTIAGHSPPAPAGEGSTEVVFSEERRFLIPLVTTLGGLISGLLVSFLAPEAEGHGTDAAIEAYHIKKGFIRARVPLVKLTASAVTIGSGGSAGREGPIAQIGAGIGALLGKVLKLNAHDRRIAVAVGIGAGIGSIFKAPLGGAILAAEILYLADFEVEALIPAFIASVIAYCIVASFTGWSPIFECSNEYIFHDPLTLPLFAVLGILCGLFGILYIRTFYFVHDTFRRLSIPGYLRPAIGGLVVGVIALFVPHVLGTGYGWLQMMIYEDFTYIPLLILIILPFAKILATAFSVGSGGSGGVFAPALVIGGSIGALLWFICKMIFPDFGMGVAPFVIVGMMAFFGGVGKVPIAVILMVSEMTGTYTLLAPSMIATIIAYIITGRNTIYRSQVRSRHKSPAHRGEYQIPLLKTILVKEAMTGDVITIRPDDPVSRAAEIMSQRGIRGIPVLDKTGNLVGIITLTDVLRTPAELRPKTQVKDVMSRKLIVAYPDETLLDAFDKMMKHEIGRLPVVDPITHKLIGIITRGDIRRAYNDRLLSLLEEGSAEEYIEFL